jgi:hypothetical protein
MPHLPGWLRPAAYVRELPPRVGLRRPRLPFGPDLRCWVSTDWPTLSRAAVEALLRTTAERPRLMRHYRRSVSPGESFFATVLMNDSALRVSGDDRRFVRFAPGAPSPYVLTSADLDDMNASGAHFARKFDAGVDPGVLDRLDELRRGAS